MYISGLSIGNKCIYVHDINMNFEQNGIYFITGENGCGKTTLLENMIFGNESIYFENPKERELFKNERYNLFTYCPQKVIINELSVKEYVCKLNKSIDVEQIQAYLHKFGFEEDVLNQKFYTLSGGEQMKISIISGLLKNTPYLFLDEPTNYLDNTAVKELVAVLEEEAKKKRIIIVSHDNRLQFKSSLTYKFCNGTVKPMFDNNNSVKMLEEGQEKKQETFGCNRLPGLRKMVVGLTKNYAYAVTFLIITCLLAAIVMVTNLDFGASVDTSEFPEQGTIFAYDMGYHDDLNTYYEEAEGLVVDEELYDRGITLSDIESISELSGVTDIYIVDELYLYQLDCFLGFVPGVEYNVDEELFLLSCPELLLNDYLECSAFNPLFKYTQGQLPKDGADEVSISKNILIKYYGYTEDDVEEAIGDSILIYNPVSETEQSYTVVGFIYYDFAVISYNPNENYGVYRFDETTFSEFSTKITDYYTDMGMIANLSDVLISVDKKAEKDILNYCFMNFPSCCYSSNYYAATFTNRQQEEAFSRWLIIHLVFSCVLAVVVWIVNRNGIRYNMRLIWDIGNYYINRRRIMLYYIITLFFEYILLTISIIAVNTVLSEFVGMINILIILDSVIMLIPLMLSCVRAYKEANK